MSWCGEAYQPYTAAALLHLMSCKTHKGVFFTPDGSFKFQRCERQGHAFDCFRNHKGLFFGPYGCVNFPRCERQGHAFDCFRNRKGLFSDPMGALISHDANAKGMLSIVFEIAKQFFEILWVRLIPTMWTCFRCFQSRNSHDADVFVRACFRLFSKPQGRFFTPLLYGSL